MKSVIKISTVLVYLALSAAQAGAQSAPATLREAIISALKLNTITRSTDVFLESIHYGTLAAKAARLPRGDAFCDASFDNSQNRYTVGDPSNSSSISRSCGVFASATIFDGGAQRDNYKAAVAAEAATRSAFNTSDSLIPNTRGGIANGTLNAYIELAMNRVSISFEEEILAVLAKFKKFSSDSIVDSEITDIQAALDEDKSSDHANAERFKFYVKLEPSPKLESLDQTIGGLKIPMTAALATADALRQGPGVLRRNSEVLSATWNLKSLKASYGPSVSVNVSASHGNYNDRLLSDNNSSYTSERVGLTLRIPLNPTAKYRVREAQSGLEAKKLERDAAIESAKYSISATYEDLEIAKQSYLTLSKNYEDQKDLIKGIISKIDSGATTDLDITKMMSAESTLRRRQRELTFKQRQMMMSLFSIEQITGRLFSDYAPQNFD